jgi:hypothetical protein
VVLYPSDEWDMKSTFNSEYAVERYLQSMTECIKSDNLIKNPHITIEELEKSSEAYKEKLFKLNYSPRLLQFPAFSFYLSDHQKSYTFSFKDGLREQPISRDKCDIELSAQALKYCFDHLWGFDTLGVSGRFQKPTNGNFLNFEEYHFLSTINNQGDRIGTKLESAIKRIKQIFA